MKRFFRWLKGLFFPPIGSTPLRRILPFVLVTFLLVAIFIGGLMVWEETNSTVFCGTACHTMPPEYVTHQNSSHASITCEDCHLGRAPIFESISRKIKYSWQTGTAMLFNTYEFPIRAKNMSPATEACIPCHNPVKFTDDKMVGLKKFAPDEKNSLTTIYMILKTGGGSSRTGLGFGIHWHIENPVYYYATDKAQQDIPYIQVVKADGKIVKYVDTETKFDPNTINPGQLQVMDCITCHNRSTHGIPSPEDAVNQMMAQNLISPTIPDIKKQAVTVLMTTYKDAAEANAAIDKLTGYYQQKYASFATANPNLIKAAVDQLKSYIKNGVFFDQKYNYSTHLDNIGHQSAPGCFRCHDGKHLSSEGEAVRLECNLCHSVPVAANSSDLVTSLPVSRGFEPPSHKNTNWITLHRSTFDKTCAGCHSVEDPGGSSNTSFCSNSVCHGATWKFAGFDAPNLREKLKTLLPTPAPTAAVAPTQPSAQPTAAPGGAKLTWVNVGPLFAKCSGCHGAGGGAKGLDYTSYAGIMGGKSSIVAGNPANSELVKLQTAGGHFGQFDAAELAKVVQWIKDGALEK